jgi:hypothetical protein
MTHDTDKKKPGKNPFVDTTFLPDREREEEERKIREKLSEEWGKEQEKVKSTCTTPDVKHFSQLRTEAPELGGFVRVLTC